MADMTQALIPWRVEHSLLNLEDLANTAGLHPELVEKFIEEGVIEPSPNTGSDPLFPVSAVERLRCAVRLMRDLGVNVASVAVILEMTECIENLKRELDLLRAPSGLGE